jgi:hypothetical protein
LLLRDLRLRSVFETVLENYDLWLITPLLQMVEALLDRSGNLPVWLNRRALLKVRLFALRLFFI